MKILIMIIVFFSSFLTVSFSESRINYPKEGKQFYPIVIQIEENFGFVNSFDLETNKVELTIEQPDKSILTLSFFYNGKNENNIEKWEARFTPKQFGIYNFAVNINGSLKEEFKIPVKENKETKQGGVIVSENLGIFKYESGEPFRGIGLNICWANDYEYYFNKMKSAGMNIVRIWICPWHLSFEWNNTGIGKYDLISANKLDEILKLAEAYNIFIILCIDYHGTGQKRAGFFNENKWLDNPYNKINGGPCTLPEELFTNELAKESFKKKYKYIISRYGYSSQIAGWEFYNEADLMAGKSIPMNQWHTEMAEYIQSIDIHNRLVTTSSTRNYPEKVIDAFKSPAMDFVMYHQYNNLNFAPYIIDFTEALIEYYKKPVVMGEFGIDYRGGDVTYKFDPQHIGLHNGIWAGLFSETPVLPLSWWWDNYIDKYNLWYEYEYLSKFAEQIELNEKVKFSELSSGFLINNETQQVPCLVRCIYFNDDAALWFKNDEYQWSLAYEGNEPIFIENFQQKIPDMKLGVYSINWYDPQTGKYFGKQSEVKLDENGNLNILVPSFSKDLACIIKKVK